MAAYRRVRDSRRLQADCQEPGISSGTLRSVIEYGLAFTFYLLTYLSAAGARDVIRAMAGRRCLLAAAAAVAAVVSWLGVAGPGRGRAAGCYSYPAGVGDPCSGRRCEFGARCRASSGDPIRSGLSSTNDSTTTRISGLGLGSTCVRLDVGLVANCSF